MQLRRSEVLKTLLQYLCEQEALGRAHEVTEYEIAVKALGRPADFSPDTDSSVRTRVLALRKKLEEFYEHEGHNVSARLEVPRGTYGVRYFTAEVEPEAAATQTASPEAAPTPAGARPARRGFSVRMAFVAGVLIGALALGCISATWTWWSHRADAEAERPLLSAWGPMLDTNESVIIALGTPVSFFIRDFGNAPLPEGDPGYRLDVQITPELRNWYRQSRNRELGNNILFHPNVHSPLWGDAAATSLLNRMLGSRGVTVQVTPSSRIHPMALRDKNAIVIGRPEYTEMAAQAMPEDGLSVEYNANERKVGVHNRAAKNGEPEWWFASSGLKHNYGLITVMPSYGSGRKRTMILSGINSDGAEAGARFMTSVDSLRDLDRRFRSMGFNEWPPHYQLVVRTESLDTYNLQTSFTFLRILK